MIKIIDYKGNIVEYINNYSIDEFKKYLKDYKHIYDSKNETIKIMNDEEYKYEKLELDFKKCCNNNIGKTNINFEVSEKCIVNGCEHKCKYGERKIYDKVDNTIDGVWLYYYSLGGWVIKQKCKIHKTDKMINLHKRVCKWCWDAKIDGQNIRKWHGYCFKCYCEIYDVKYNRNKQYTVYKYLEKLNNNNIYLIYDKILSFTNNTTYRPDIQIITDTKVILIEIDEHQHNNNNYSKSKEINRTNELQKNCNDNNKKMIMIRFNPDSYKSDDKYVESCWKNNELIQKNLDNWNNRLEILNNKLNYYLTNDVNDNIIEYLFYSE